MIHSRRALILTDSEPAGGAAIDELIAATAVAALGLVALGVVTWRYRRGGLGGLRALAGFAGRVAGLPTWAALPIAVIGGALITAVFGFYWDVATHIDNGRDPGPFANPAHFFILAGLGGIAVGGWLSVLLGTRTRTSIRVGDWSAPLGGFLVLICGAAALAGFPLDDVWHRLFGQDVTLWGPTHIQMVGGASLSTLGLWVLLVEAAPASERTGRVRSLLHRNADALVAGAFLVGLSTLQGEFDYGVPQFSLLYHPTLIMLAGSIGLVAARLRVGRWGALKAALMFIALRAALTLVVGPGLGRLTLHFPLYLVEAVVVEAIATRIGTGRQLRFGIFSGIGIGTVGLAAEWIWSRVWMPIPWPAALLPEGATLGFAAAVAGGIVGAFIGAALTGAAGRSLPRRPAAVAAAVVVACLALPAGTSAGDDVTANVVLRDTGASDGRAVVATVRLDPAHAADDAYWFTALAWQGYDWERGSSRIVELEPTGEGLYRTEEPIPVGGPWKTLLRLQAGERLLALPVYLPRDDAIPAPEVPAPARFERAFVPDKEIVQREAITSNVWLQRTGYAVMLAIGALWLVAIGWGLMRLRSRVPPAEPDAAQETRDGGPSSS